MAEFYVPVTNEFFASQIAGLLNKYNKLTVLHDVNTILNSNTKYFVELISAPAIENSIAGCVGIVPEYNTLSKIKHICIDPTYRRFGIASKLVKTAILNCHTEYVYMTIRNDNIGSLKLAKSLGFVLVQKDMSRDHSLITVGRRR